MNSQSISGQWQYLKVSALNVWTRFIHEEVAQEKISPILSVSMGKNDIFWKMGDVHSNTKASQNLEGLIPGGIERRREPRSGNRVRTGTYPH